jgi:mitotic-spindle organizing protein 1
VYELSRLLNTGLDRDTLAILMALIQKGVNPEALAAVVKDLRKDAAEHTQTLTQTEPRTITGAKQPLSTQELQVSQVCLKKQAALLLHVMDLLMTSRLIRSLLLCLSMSAPQKKRRSDY